MKNIKGYTLIEVAIVMMILALLSIICKGFYDRAIERSRFAEAYAVVGTILNAQKDFYIQNERFAKDLEELNLDIDGEPVAMHWTPETKGVKTKHFKYGTSFFEAPSDTEEATVTIEVIRNVYVDHAYRDIGVQFKLHIMKQDQPCFKDGVEYPRPAGTFFVVSPNHISPNYFSKSNTGIEMAKLEKHFTYKAL